MKKVAFLAIAALGIWAARPASADNWDQTASINDSSSANTTNELVHGTVQTHDLDATNSGLADDEDWYFVSQKPFSSYEVLVDSTTPYLNRSTAVFLALVDAGGTVDTTDYSTSSTGFTRSLRFANLTTTAVDTNWARVSAPTDCNGTCDTRDTYNVRMFETTYTIPRYNNTATQFTILLIQNPTDFSTGMNIYFWSAAGALVGQTSSTLGARSALVLNTSTVAGVGGTSGSVTVAHNNRYGSLTGKAVAVEPGTGFTFDTPMVPHP